MLYDSNRQEYTRGDKHMTNIKANNIANVVGENKDNARVTASHFTQNSGASTQDLLNIIASLRQAAAIFPAEQQENIIIDLEDVEEQVQKPESDRNPKRLKKSLTALLAAATFAAGGVTAGVEVTENLNKFADNVRELGSKVGIELNNE